MTKNDEQPKDREEPDLKPETVADLEVEEEPAGGVRGGYPDTRTCGK